VLGPEIERHDTEAEADRLKRSYKYFFLKAWEHIDPNPLVMNWHLELTCDYLQALEEDTFKDLLVNLPPGCSKSMAVSVIWPAWLWLRDPSKTMYGFSYALELSTNHMAITRKLMMSDWYKRYTDFELVIDKREIMTNNRGGWRRAGTPGGAATGFHPQYVIIDDPHNAKKAESEAERNSVIDWYKLTLSTRGAALGRRTACVCQRLHRLDLAGVMIDTKPKMAHLLIPMRYELNEDGSERNKDIGLGQDPRTKEGELMCPAFMPEEVVATIEASMGPYGTAGQYQQRPTVREGTIFKMDRIEVVKPEAVPVGLKRVVRGWDRAGTKGSGDYSAGVCLGLFDVVDPDTGALMDRTIYVLGVSRGRWEAPRTNKMMKLAAGIDEAKYGMGRCKTIFEQEPGASGKLVAQLTKKELAGHRVTSLRPQGSKVVRAEGLATAIDAYSVKVVSGEWTDSFVEELTEFPKGAHDDQVDAASMAFLELVQPTSYDLPSRERDDDGSAYDMAWCGNEKSDRRALLGEEYCCSGSEAQVDAPHKPIEHTQECNNRHGAYMRTDQWYPHERFGRPRPK